MFFRGLMSPIFLDTYSMLLEIWILEKNVEQLKKLCTSWLSFIDRKDQAIRYTTIQPKTSREWICVNISLDDYTNLIDHNLLQKT